MLFELQEARDRLRGIPVQLLMRNPFPTERPELTSSCPGAAQAHVRANQRIPSGAHARGHTWAGASKLPKTGGCTEMGLCATIAPFVEKIHLVEIYLGHYVKTANEEVFSFLIYMNWPRC